MRCDKVCFKQFKTVNEEEKEDSEEEDSEEEEEEEEEDEEDEDAFTNDSPLLAACIHTFDS